MDPTDDKTDESEPHQVTLVSRDYGSPFEDPHPINTNSSDTQHVKNEVLSDRDTSLQCNNDCDNLICHGSLEDVDFISLSTSHHAVQG